MGRKIGRPKAGQAALTRERILTTALRLVDDQGVAALSMRRLAAELGVDPMAIYHHLPNKQAVLSGLVELAFNELQVPTTAKEVWQDQVRAFARAYHRLSRAHPNLVLYLVTDAEARANAAVYAANEALYAALARAGLTPQQIVRAADLVVDYLNGFALAMQSGNVGQASEREEFVTQLNRHPHEHFPVMHWVMSSLIDDEITGDMEAGFNIILAGIAAIAGEAKSSGEE